MFEKVVLYVCVNALGNVKVSSLNPPRSPSTGAVVRFRRPLITTTTIGNGPVSNGIQVF